MPKQVTLHKNERRGGWAYDYTETWQLENGKWYLVSGSDFDHERSRPVDCRFWDNYIACFDTVIEHAE